MKATGIVRRIDDLGRVVIPKEIRRTMRIREGDPLEIYTSSNGEVVFKKYSPIGELSSFATQYADVLCKMANVPAIVCDRDHVIAVAGMPKKEVLERRVSPALEEAMLSRKTYVCHVGDEEKLKPIEGIDRYSLVCAPIVSSGDLGGAVLFVSDNIQTDPDEAQIKLAQAAAMFLGKQIET